MAQNLRDRSAPQSSMKTLNHYNYVSMLERGEQFAILKGSQSGYERADEGSPDLPMTYLNAICNIRVQGAN
jgi:hypothetical protein